LAIFKRLPEVTKIIQQLAVEENQKFLGRGFTEAELKGLADELKRMVVTEMNFGLLDSLTEQVTKYKKLPGEIAEQKSKIAAMGSKDILEHQAMRANHKIARKENVIREAKGSVEGMALAKEGVQRVQDLEKGVVLVEKVFLAEAEQIYEGHHESFKQLEASQKKLLEAEKEYGRPGDMHAPDVSALKAKFQEVNKKKKDPQEYLQALTDFDFAANLQKLKQDIANVCQNRIETFRNIKSRPKESTKYPKLEEGLIKFKAIKDEASTVVIDGSLRHKAEALQNDSIQMENIRQGLGHLEADPGNYRLRMMVENSQGAFQTNEGRQLESRLTAGLASLAETQEKLDRVPASDDDIRFATRYSQKGFMGRLISKNPEKQMRKTAERAASEVESLEFEKAAIEDSIGIIEGAEFALSRLENQNADVRKNLLKTLELFDLMFKVTALDARDEIDRLVNSEDPMDMLKAKEKMDLLISAREQAPDLYVDQDDDSGDEIFVNSEGAKNLKDLRDSYLSYLTVKVELAIKKSLDALTDNELTTDSFAMKLIGFEAGLGSLVNTEQYQKVRLEAFKNAASGMSRMHVSKRFLLGEVLRQATQKGFVRGSNLDLKGFVNSMRPKNQAVA
jgi:hypothetical protein